MTTPPNELAAYAAITEAIEAMEAARSLCEAHRVELPGPFRRYFGIDGGGGPKKRHNRKRGESPPSASSASPPSPGSAQGKLPIPGPGPMQRPPRLPAHWIRVRAEAASPTSLILALLRDAAGPMPFGRVESAVRQFQPEANRGSLMNVAWRRSETIERTDDGWQLIRDDAAPQIVEEDLWGPADTFSSQEQASYRREAVLSHLRNAPGGLRAVELLEAMREDPSLREIATKDLIRQDLTHLREQGLAALGPKKRWQFAAEEG